MSDVMVLTENENKLKQATKEVDKQAANLGVEAVLADKYAVLTSETPDYPGFKNILLNLPSELHSTAEFWRNTAKTDLQNSLASIRSFCTTYKSYFPDLIEEITSGGKTVTEKKDVMLEYLGEVRPELNKSIGFLKTTQDSSNEFLHKVENHKDKLESTVLPNIKKVSRKRKPK